MLKSGTFLGGRYEIVSRIGSGGMSDVYKATDKKLNRFVAIKVLKSQFSTEQNFVGKFRMEAQNAAKLSHPNIVSVYDVGEDRGVHYIVMELIEGITLKKYIERKKKLEIRESIEVAMQVARGIEAAHAQQIIHRDIKPQNIMISRDGKVKVTDFGIARASSSQTISSNTMGSVHYISPEQARGGYCDERSDIYSLGITLYEMLTGRVPYEGDSTISVALLHIQGEMIPPRQLEPLIPVNLEKIILKCTQKKAELRYASATELISDLKKSLTIPNEDFVKISSLHSDSPTVVISDNERDEINRLRRNDDEDDYDDYDEYDSDYDYDYEYDDDRDYDRDYDRGYDRDYNRDYEDRRYDDRDFDDRHRSASGMEKLITGISIAIAALIVVIVVALIMRGCGGEPILPVAETTASSAETTTEEAKVSMRNLIGMTQAQAVQVLTDQGLGYSIQAGTSGDVGEGEVYEQEYKEGEMLKVGTVVTLKISTGTGTAQIPASVLGMSEKDARKALEKAGFEVASSTGEEYSDDVKKGKVSSTEPAAGTIARDGATVTLTLSLGPEEKTVLVPDITGVTQSKAISLLEDHNLKAGSITEEKSSTVPKGMVISQSVDAGTEVEEGSKIGFVVSEGAASTTVPNLLYSTLSEAKEALREAGLEVGSVTEEYSDESTKGLVISQSISKNAEVDMGTSIDLVIGLGEKPTEAPKVETTEAKAETAAKETTAAPKEPETEEETEPETYSDGGDPDVEG